MMDNNRNIQRTAGISKFYSKVYGYLGLGILLSAVTYYVISTYYMVEVMSFIYGSRINLFLMWGIQIGLVIYLGKNAFTNSGKSLFGYVIYTILTGFTVTATMALYPSANVGLAFLTAAGMFIAMSLVGLFIKKDLSAMGRAMIGLLIGSIIGIFLNLFVLHSSAVDLFISFGMVIIFSGLIAYDNQKIKVLYEQMGNEASSGLAIYCALLLYLDLVNLFLYLLRIFSRD